MNADIRVFSRRMLPQHIAAIVVLTVVGAVLAWGRTPPMTVVSNSIHTPQVQPGGTLTVTRKVEWLRPDCRDAVMTAEFVDSMGFHHLMSANDLGKPYTDSMSIQSDWPIPFTMPWGKATYRSRLSFSCFPFDRWWPIEVDLPDLTFQVVETPSVSQGGGL